jgi:hypothetical protein
MEVDSYEEEIEVIAEEVLGRFKSLVDELESFKDYVAEQKQYVELRRLRSNVRGEYRSLQNVRKSFAPFLSQVFRLC